jgi:hypothetical protein
MGTTRIELAFFADHSELPTQQQAQAYGPLSVSPSTKFRVTSLFTGTNRTQSPNPTAIAAAGGKLIVVAPLQTTPGNKRLNLILRPDTIPDGMPRVKYFIYRGLVYSDFLKDTGTGPAVRDKAADDSELIKDIRKGKNAMKALYTFPDGDFDGLQIGITTSLDRIFAIKEANFHQVRVGQSLGRFDGAAGFNYGFEILLDDPGFNPQVDIARMEVHEMALSGLPAEDAKERVRQEILHYLDPAAFYGSCFRVEKVALKGGYSTTPFSLWSRHFVGTTPKLEEYSLAKIYTELLVKFGTANRVYLDVRESNGLPVDFASTYGASIRRTADGQPAAAATNTVYRSSGWPIHIVEAADFRNSQHRWQANIKGGGWPASSTADLDLYLLNLSLNKGSDNSATLQLETGTANSTFPLRIEDAAWPLDYDSANPSWTRDMQLAVPSVRAGTSMLPVATYVRIRYMGRSQANAAQPLLDQVPEFQYHDIRYADLASQLEYPMLPITQEDIATTPDDIAKTYRWTTVVRTSPWHCYGEERGSAFFVRKGASLDAYGQTSFAFRSRREVRNGAQLFHSILIAAPAITAAQPGSQSLDLTVPAANLRKGQAAWVFIAGVTGGQWTNLNAAAGFTVTGQSPGHLILALKAQSWGTANFANSSMAIVFPGIVSSANDPRLPANSRFLDLASANDKTAASYYDCIAGVLEKDNEQLQSTVVEVESGQESVEIRSFNPLVIKARDLGLFEPAYSLSISHDDATKAELQVTFFAGAPIHYVLRDVPVTPASGDRKYLKAKLALRGIVFENNAFHWSEVLLEADSAHNPIYACSLDGFHFSTMDYSSKYRAGTKKIKWANTVTPAVNNFPSAVQSRLAAVLAEIAGVEARLLQGEIRSYLYAGDLDNVTREIAFRLPFFSERTKPDFSGASPVEFLYSGNNNPYAAKFDTPAGSNWFEKANEIRALAGNLSPLTISGYTQATANLAIDDVSFYQLLFSYRPFAQKTAAIATMRNLYSSFNSTQAFLAKTMHDENPFKSTVIGVLAPKPVVPAEGQLRSQQKTLIVDTSLASARDDLQALEDNGVISSAVHAALLNLPNGTFGCGPTKKGLTKTLVLGGTPVAFSLDSGITHFVCRNANATSGTKTTYFIFSHLGGVAGASSVTVSFGFDLGQNKWDDIASYTQYNDGDPDAPLAAADQWKPLLAPSINRINDDGSLAVSPNNTLEKLVKEVAPPNAKQKNAALAYFFPFKDVLWDKLVMNPVPSITFTKKLMKQNYLKPALAKFHGSETPAAYSSVLRAYRENKDAAGNVILFYDAGGARFMNEVEAWVLITMAYNGGIKKNFNWSFNATPGHGNRVPTLLAHAINTHDVRWLIEAVKVANLYGSRAGELLDILRTQAILAHYKS